jgi:PAS domain S-box-containing protein
MAARSSSGPWFLARALLFTGTLLVCLIVVAAVFYTNKTLRSIEKNLPITLFGEFNSLSLTLEDVAALAASAGLAATSPDAANLAQLRGNIARAQRQVVGLRDTYVANNMVNASAFHAVLAPAIADLQIWQVEGVSGHGADSPLTLGLMRQRIAEALRKATAIRNESWGQAQAMLETERGRLEAFQRSVNLLFVLALLLAFMLLVVSYRRSQAKNRELEAAREVQRQHSLLTSLLYHIPLGVAVWDQDKTLLHLNPGFTAITGYDGGDLKRLADWPILAYPDEVYRRQVVDHWRAVGRGGVGCQYRVTCKNGTVREIEFNSSVIPDRRVLATLTDMTERNRNERALQESRQLEARAKKMESLGLLVGGVAHDLNNILSGIVSYPDLLLFELPQDHHMRQPIEVIQQSGQRASAIVQDLLTVARGVAVAKEPINLRTVVEEYVQSPEFRMVEQFHPGIVLHTKIAEDCANILGSRIHLRKVMMNLVSNAFEASIPPGEVHITLGNRCIKSRDGGDGEVEEGDYVQLQVADRGKGISKEDLEKIFEPFYSKKVMGRSGTGLGLTVVWNVVHDHHGYIDVVSSDQGTQFTVLFPVTAERERGLQPVVDLARLRGHGETVLVVDDVATQRLITSSIVEKLGYQVETVPSGEAAVDYLRRKPVDVLILDMIMSPGINGRVTYERIIAMYPRQKAIIVSGYAETEEVKEALRLGAGCFLKKPLMIHELAHALVEELHPSTAESGPIAAR